MKLFRAINKDELKEFLELNGLKSRDEIKKGTDYKFKIHEKTIWVNRQGKKSWNIYDIAKNERNAAGVVFTTKSLFARGFEENPLNPGKFYCKKTHTAEVRLG